MRFRGFFLFGVRFGFGGFRVFLRAVFSVFVGTSFVCFVEMMVRGFFKVFRKVFRNFFCESELIIFVL